MNIKHVEVALGFILMFVLILFVSPWGQKRMAAATAKGFHEEEERQNNIRLFGRPDV
jgi:hypothetical protein